MSKLSAAKIKEMASWVEVNGLYPQPCGAPVSEFCKAMGITRETYRKWMKREELADALTKARETFRSSTVVEVVNKMKQRALGYNEQLEDKHYKGQVVIEYDPVTGKKVKEYLSGKAVLEKQVTRTVHHPPDVGAGIFLLTNLDPENWKNRRDEKTDISAALEFEDPPQIIFTSGAATKKDEVDGKPTETATDTAIADPGNE